MATAPTTIQERAYLPVGVGPGGVSPPSAGDILAMLRRRAILITFLFVFFSAIALGGFAVWYLYFPGFRSECLIECISNIPETELTLDQERLRQDEHERFVRTQAYLLKSPSILAEALKITAVRETSWYRSILPNQHLLTLTDELVATPLRGTNFLRVVMGCRDRNDPRVIVNEVVRQWYDEVKQRSAEAFATGSLDAARTELDDLDRSIGADRDRLKGIAQRLPPGAVQNPAENITAQQVRQFGEQVALLELEMSQLEQFRAIYNDPEGVAVTAEDRAMVERDLQVAELARTVFLEKAYPVLTLA